MGYCNGYMDGWMDGWDNRRIESKQMDCIMDELKDS